MCGYTYCSNWLYILMVLVVLVVLVDLLGGVDCTNWLYILVSVSDPDPDPDPDPPGSACFWPVRIRIRRKCGSGSGSGSWLKMPISLTIWQVFCLVDFSFFKFILKNAHFLNILVNFWVLWKNVENFLIPEFFWKILL